MVTLATAPKANGAASTPSHAPVPSQGKPPLWPKGKSIEVIGLTGDFATGKTIFAVSICPGVDTLVYDVEKSSGAYQSLGFDRIDVPAEMVKAFPNGYQPVDLFNWWWANIKAIPPGKYRVIVLDPVSEIESGIVDYVRRNPEKFGYTAKQFTLAAGLMWGAVKDFWKSILADLAARCETFVFTSHLRNVWKGGAPTGKKAPKGKETLMELASLYLHMERKPDAKGIVPEVPSATVIKHRLSDHIIDEATGEIKWVDLLPPRLPIATPAAIRQYILNPPDYGKLKPAERVVEEKVTEQEMAEMKLATAEAERDAEAMRLELLNRASSVAANQAALRAASDAAKKPEWTVEKAKAKDPTAAAILTPASNTKTAPTQAAPTTPSASIEPTERITDDLLEQLAELRHKLGIDGDGWKAILAKRGVTTARDFTMEQGRELFDAMSKRFMASSLADGLGVNAGN